MNIIKKIARIYNISLLEEFFIADDYGSFPTKYRFSLINGLEMKIQGPSQTFWVPESGYMFVNLLTGKLRIKKEDKN